LSSLNININIPVAPLLIWVELHTGWTFIIDIFSVFFMYGCILGWFLGWCSTNYRLEKK